MNFIIENKQYQKQILYVLNILVRSEISIYYGKQKPQGFTGLFIPESDFWRNYKMPESLPKKVEVTDHLVKLYGDDLVAAAFFMLTQYEMLFNERRDEEGRFPATVSLAYRHGFLDRPIVDEYRVYLAKSAQKPQFKVLFTHDVDKITKPKLTAVVTELKNVLRLRWSGLLGILYNVFNPKNPADTFDWLYDLEKGQGLYFFMLQSEDGYTLDSPEIVNLRKKIKKQSYQEGLHWDKEKIKKSEFKINRNHFLRFDLNTWDTLAAMGITDDYTMAYADQVGFRCGTCRPFKVFSLATDQALELIEHPLTIMDVTLYSYMKLSPSQAWQKCVMYFETVKKYGGEFIVLWHNFSLDEVRWRVFYKKMVNYLKRGIKK
jgi:hypothetical protein